MQTSYFFGVISYSTVQRKGNFLKYYTPDTIDI